MTVRLPEGYRLASAPCARGYIIERGGRTIGGVWESLPCRWRVWIQGRPLVPAAKQWFTSRGQAIDYLIDRA